MNRTCRGAINLAGAFIDTVDSCSFVINGGSQVWHLRAASEIERQRWVTTLELAKAKAIKNLGSGDFFKMFRFCNCYHGFFKRNGNVKGNIQKKLLKVSDLRKMWLYLDEVAFSL